MTLDENPSKNLAIDPDIGDPKAIAPDTATEELLTLLRLLVREPPPDHDFRTCPICMRHGIRSI